MITIIRNFYSKECLIGDFNDNNITIITSRLVPCLQIQVFGNFSKKSTVSFFVSKLNATSDIQGDHWLGLLVSSRNENLAISQSQSKIPRLSWIG